MKKRIITVVGKDSVGITAKVCVYLADNQINILDIAQTIVAGYFNMMMVVDTQASPKSTELIASELSQIGDEIGVQIKVQHEAIFETMHRI
ncbi:MAG: ACT domain-containing protein [Coprococcus sp.]|nr:ACT domain-containing protein [Coprococcus sp.]